MILYHGTDIDSALDILNNGLDATKLTALQYGHPTQLGAGWYAACDAEAAWFFASLAPGNVGRGYAVIEVDIPDDMLNQLEATGQAIKNRIANVPFTAAQYCFRIDAFAVLNTQVIFRPLQGEESSHG